MSVNLFVSALWGTCNLLFAAHIYTYTHTHTHAVASNHECSILLDIYLAYIRDKLTHKTLNYAKSCIDKIRSWLGIGAE